MKRFLHIVLVLVVAAACQGPRYIPKDTLADIYADMFLADQMVREMGIPRVQMDTMLLYEAVFRKYGYDTDDYQHTVRYYLRDPERFAKVLETASKRLEEEVNALDKVIRQQAAEASKRDAKYPLMDSLLAPFSKDAQIAGRVRIVRDTARYAAWIRLLPVREDSLLFWADSLAVLADKDSLQAEAPADSAAAKLLPLERPLRGNPVIEVEEVVEEIEEEVAE